MTQHADFNVTSTWSDYVTHRDNRYITHGTLKQELKAIGLKEFLLTTQKDNGEDLFTFGAPLPEALREVVKGIEFTLELGTSSDMTIPEVKQRLKDLNYTLQSDYLMI